MPFAAMWMDLESIMLRQILYDITYMWNLKNNTNEYINICKTETDSQIQKTNFWLPKERGKGGGTNLRYGINRYKLLYIKQISNKDILYSTGNYIQYLVIMDYNLQKH